MDFCRVCESSESLVSLEEYEKRFLDITGISVSLPSSICRQCLETLNSAFLFRIKAIATEQKLQGLLEAKKSPHDERARRLEIVKRRLKSRITRSEEKASTPEVSPVPKQSCPYCLLDFRDTDDRVLHIKDHLRVNGGLECDLCHQKYASKSVLLAHIKKVHLLSYQRRFRCSSCGLEFASVFSLKEHKKAVHDQENPSRIKFVCSQCGKQFSRRSTMVSHVKFVHERVRKSKCEECGKEFSDNNHLRAHMLVHTKQKDFTCSICNKAFSQKGNLTKHELTHNETLDFPCDVCGKLFKHQYLVKLHRALHFSNFPFSCEVCSAKFKTRSNFVTHRKIHENVAIPCTFEGCEKIFRSKQSLRNHLRTHTGDLFSCDECGAKFQQQYDVKRHAMTVHEGVRFVCGVCDRGFTKQTSLNRHVKLLHFVANV